MKTKMIWMKRATCPDCDGTCRVWRDLTGTGIRTTRVCTSCEGGQVWVRMSNEEVRAMVERALAELEGKAA